MHKITDNFEDPLLDNMMSRDILVDNRENSSELEDYQVNFAIEEKQLFFEAQDGLRFVDENLKIIDHWNESFLGTQWIKVPKIISSAMCTLRMLSGNPSGDSASNGKDTFNMFDDFADGDYTSNPAWTVGSGTFSASNYYLMWLSGGTAYINTPCTMTTFAVEGKFYYESDNHTGNYFEIVMLNATHDGYGLLSNKYYDASTKDVIINEYTDYWVRSELTSVNGQGAGHGAWHTFKFTRDGSNALKGYVDGNYKVGVTDLTIASFTELNINDRGYDSVQYKRYDDIRVREYNDPEPTTEIGMMI